MNNDINQDSWFNLGNNVTSGICSGFDNEATNKFFAMLKFVEISKNAWYVYRRIRTGGWFERRPDPNIP